MMQPSTQLEPPLATGADSPSTGATGTATSAKIHVNGGRFDFDDGGTYCGGWEDGKAHGHGVCTGPKGQGAYTGSWHYGFEVSGVYTWPSGSAFEGQWQNGKRHGLGVETRGRWLYRGEWTQGYKGRYGVRQSATSNAKYEGTWANGLQDGYGSETYADGGTYQGQWLRGMRHGYGVRASAPFGLASRYRPNKSLRASLTSLRSIEGNNGTMPVGADAAVERDRRVDNSRGGFVLKARSDEPPARRRSLIEKSSGIKKSIMSGLKIRKQRSTGDLEKRGTSGGSIRSTGSSASWVSTESSHSGVTAGSLHTDSNASFVVEDEHLDASVTETYMGEWKNDKRTGFGISERSDGLRYEGEWFANKKYGYGVTTLRDGSKEEGKYKNNVLITSQKKRHLFLIRSAKFRERIDSAVNAAQRASKIALQKADIAISRMSTARGKAEQADTVADLAREDYATAIATAKQFAPDFVQPGPEKLKTRHQEAFNIKSILTDKSIEKPTVPSGMDQTTTKPSVSISSPQQIRSTPPPSSLNPSKLPSSQQFPQSSYQPSDSMSYQMKPQVNHYQQQQQQQQQQQNQQQYLPQQQPQFSQQGPTANSYQQKQPLNSQSYQQQQLQQQMPMNSGYQQQPSMNQYQSVQPTNQYQQSQGQANQYSSMQMSNSQYQSQQPFNQYQQQTPQSNAQMYQQQTPSYQYQQPNSPPQSYVPNYGNGQTYSGYPQDTNPQQRIASLPTSPYDQDKSYMPNQITPEENLGLHQRRASIRRNSKPLSGDHPGYTFQQIQNDRFDQYKRPPSRDSSVDRYTRAASRLSGTSRQASVDKLKSFDASNDPKEVRSSSVIRSPTPVTGNGAVLGPGAETAFNSTNKPKAPFEDIIVRKRSLGQDIVPSPLGQPKRTESLYTNPLVRKEAIKPAAIPNTSSLQRKKSLPDFQGLPQATRPIPREEASILSSARREEIRRQQEESDRLRANPLLYLVSPHVRDWFSRQQLLIMVLFINISLAIIFIKLLT